MGLNETQFRLYDYQEECIQNCLRELLNGQYRQVVSLPVGSGKTVVMANLLARVPNPTEKATKTLVLAHRTELLNQAQEEIMKYNPSLRVVIDQGKRKSDIASADVIVASVQTLARKGSQRLERYSPDEFKMIIIDEAHHAVASTYSHIFKHFNIKSPNNNIFVWGCSATVRRHDGIALGSLFDVIAYEKGFLDMVEEGRLSAAKVVTVKTYTDLSKVAHRNDDFQVGELAKAVNVASRNAVVINSYKKFAQHKRKATLVFAVDMAHTETLCNMFRAEGIHAEFITSKTSMARRTMLIERFKRNEYPVLVNCAILTEGTNIPIIDCILMARPTQSHVLFQQMFGRGMRRFPNKQDCLIIDFVDNFTRSGTQGLVTFPTLMGLNPDEEVNHEDVLHMEKRAIKAEQAKKALPELDDHFLEKSVKLKITEYDDFGEFMVDFATPPSVQRVSLFNWISLSDSVLVLPVMSMGLLKLKKVAGGLWTAHFKKLVSKGKYEAAKTISLHADELNFAVKAAETWLRKKADEEKKGYILRSMYRSAGFRRHTATEAQLKLLSRYSVEPQGPMSKGQAMDLINYIRLGTTGRWKKELRGDGKVTRKTKSSSKQESQHHGTLRRETL